MNTSTKQERELTNMSTTHPDATEGHVDLAVWPDEEVSDRVFELLGEEEILEEQRLWALQVDYTDKEVADEYKRRFPF